MTWPDVVMVIALATGLSVAIVTHEPFIGVGTTTGFVLWLLRRIDVRGDGDG